MLVVGVSHKTAPIGVREKFFLNPSQQDLLLSELKNHPQITEGFVLSTCNRTEVYLKCLNEDVGPSFVVALIAKVKKINFDFDTGLYVYSYEGPGALDHLLRVACGLESMVLGEKQILGQVKLAVERSHGAGTLSRYFNILTNVAIRAGKKAQNETQISHGGSSVSWAAVKMAEKALGDLKGKSVLVIGAGKMGGIALEHLQGLGVKKIFLMNRTGEKAEALAAKYNGIPSSFWNIREILSEADVCFCAVGAPHYILDKEKIADIASQRGGRLLVLIDISMPRNIDPEVGKLADVHLSAIDDLQVVLDNNMKKRSQAVHQVEDIIRQKITEFKVKIAKLEHTPGTDFYEHRRMPG
ncbi:MAG: glutamyl-tRNA reductase [Candidatus Omnitrophica bacterium]|nr:glutamyl-tRNA reductase [Candidatus Omnitrophota bacterium]MDE2009705.1 glutamyl-tRNA reductase [Candidatus Omnitrophota bacterium]MDE2213898.1 glutamyl-tRNA reductase [Candidatus Omnitrophota bacterium]MDE2231843.1 glutamyl-tRNA reductase [Candidatus Omnitrophota bacterium]